MALHCLARALQTKRVYVVKVTLKHSGCIPPGRAARSTLLSYLPQPLPGVARDPAAGDMAGPWFARDAPQVWETAEADVELPGYDTRRELTARDPWAVVTASKPWCGSCSAPCSACLCFRCPNCTCRDQTGHGFHVTGGVLGLVKAMCGAIEYQANSTPHFHGNIYLAYVWQQPLQKLAELLRAEVLHAPQVLEFQQWLHCEQHLQYEQHQATVQEVEQAWLQNFKERKRDALCLWPLFLQQDTQPSAWAEPQAAAAAAAEAARFKAAYEAAVQQKFTHQQHHVHPWNLATKSRLPLPACRKKNAPNKCKHGFRQSAEPSLQGHLPRQRPQVRAQHPRPSQRLGHRAWPPPRPVAFWHLPRLCLDAHGKQPQRPEFPCASHG